MGALDLIISAPPGLLLLYQPVDSVCPCGRLMQVVIMEITEEIGAAYAVGQLYAIAPMPTKPTPRGPRSRE
jgi:hypothetical protein